MKRYLIVAIAIVAFAATAQAGGPPPMYVVVDKVILAPNSETPESIRIEGSFVRLENVKTYEFGKPVAGYVYLSIEKGKEKACRSEWAKWQKAAGTGKAVSVGSCGEAGTLLTVKIHKLDEKTSKPDVVYSTEYLERFGSLYADGDWLGQSPVRELLAFAKERKSTAPATRR